MCPGNAFRSERMQWRQPISLSHSKLHLQSLPCNSRKTADCNICAASIASLSRASIVSLRVRSSLVMRTGLNVRCLAWHGYKLQFCSMGTSKISSLPPNETVRFGCNWHGKMLVETMRRGDAFRHAMSAGRRVDDCDHHQSAHQANCS